jgi:[acyl-carrier-protein] S-malonyltransferase
VTDTAEPPPIAWLFPGQGSQRVGMGNALAAADPAVAALIARADDALGFPLSRLIFEGPADDLQATANQQPAILAVSIAYLTALQDRDLLPAPTFVAGHSLGEYSALVAAGVLAFDDALRLVRRRGELMQEHGAGAMAAVIGLPAAVVAEIAAAAGAEVANFNAPDQTTIAGRDDAVTRAITLAAERGAKRALRLPVSAAFHSSLMAPVAAALRPMIEAVPLQRPSVPLIANVDARPLTEPADLRRELLDQITASVRWVDVAAALSRAGVTTHYEIGPGKVLAGLIARCDRTARVVTAESIL